MRNWCQQDQRSSAFIMVWKMIQMTVEHIIKVIITQRHALYAQGMNHDWQRTFCPQRDQLSYARAKPLLPIESRYCWVAQQLRRVFLVATRGVGDEARHITSSFDGDKRGFQRHVTPAVRPPGHTI